MVDIEGNLRAYLHGAAGSAGRQPNARYASFDFCYNYFQSFGESGNPTVLANADHLQESCLQLGFYLASWGMLRGKADLLRRSARYLVPVIEAVASAERPLWRIDVDRYTDASIEQLLMFADRIRRAMPGARRGASDTLVTKIMLGVFGSVPAFDRYFTQGLGVSTLCPRNLKRVGAFYQEHAEVIDRHRVPTLDFAKGEPTSRLYTRAKVIDMVFFIEGGG
jgi:hypothetical protein